jgi:hypothetical protein
MIDSAQDSANKVQPSKTPSANSEQDTGSASPAAQVQVRRPGPDAIREQLAKLLASPRFASSPRCQHLLTHVVEESLSGNADSLKERNIGIAVFKRDPAYDTNADPTVRVAISETRKKLAQYYYEPGNHDEIRIELPMGSYAPTFSLADHPGEESGRATQGVLSPATQPAPLATSALSSRLIWLAAGMALAVASIAIVAAGWRMFAPQSPVDVFWDQIVRSPNPVLLCVGQYGYLYGAGTEHPPASVSAHGPVGNLSSELTTVILDDAITQAKIAAQLSARNKSYSVLSESKTTYEDLQKGPSVILGAFNNPWAMRFTQSMRYRFEHDAGQFQWIADSNNPKVAMGKQNLDQGIYGPEEYAIVARIIQPETKQPTIIMGGVTPAGTLAAGNFVTSPQLLGEFLKTAPKDWQKKNLEIVLSINVIDNQPGPPHVAASVVW